MIPESLELIRLWMPGVSPSQLSEEAIKTGVFSRTTARRTRNLVTEMFAPRYLTENGAPASRLKTLVSRGVSSEFVTQLCFLYTARAQVIFADFVIDVFWPRYHSGAESISRDDAELFVRRSIDAGLTSKRWSESTVKRVSGYLIGCLADFGLVAKNKRGLWSIQRFEIHDKVVIYLAYELRARGLDNARLAESPDWKLYGLDIHQVVDKLRLAARDGHLIVQSGGELIDVSWRYPSIEECVNAISQG
jgi:hypothetical protein